MNWKTTEHDGLPKPKITPIETKNDTHFMVESSIELLCSDGKSIWHDFYDPEMDADTTLFVTHYIRVDEIPVPDKNK